MPESYIFIAVMFYVGMFVCSGFAFIFGAVNFFKKKTAMYAQLITCSMGCFAMSYLFELLLVYATGEIRSGFQVGNLGLIGGMAFLFSASYGQMDGLVDDRSKEFLKYRLIALIAPLAILLLYLPSLFGSVQLQTKLVTLLQFLFIGPAAYYNLKHIIIPDVDLGIIKSIRGYNITALILELFVTLELVSTNLEMKIPMIAFAVALSITFVLIIPMLKRGMKKWTI